MATLNEILEQAADTKALITEAGAIESTPEMFSMLFGVDKRAVIVADTTTYKVAGERLQHILESSEIATNAPIILDHKDMHAEWKYIEELDALLRHIDAVPIAVGSGTINDLAKLCAYHKGVPYMTVGTAASMDGYTAYGASITRNGAKQTFSCPAPKGFIADTDIIAGAPTQMTASGYADLYAKIPAGADWILSDYLGVEKVDKASFSAVQDHLKEALANPAAIRKRDSAAIGKLIDGLLFGGFAMQMHRTSRPASGAEHQLSHLWNMEHHVMANGTQPSHGFQVAVGTLLSIALYEEFLASDIEDLDVEACVDAWPTLDHLVAQSRALFAHTDFPEIGVVEQTAKYIDGVALREQLTRLKEIWPKLKKALREQLIPLETAKESFRLVGAPTRPQDIDISPVELRRSALSAQHIRRRFTILDIGVRTGMLERWLDAALPRIC